MRGLSRWIALSMLMAFFFLPDTTVSFAADPVFKFVNPNSKYRKVDKSGGGVPEEVWKRAGKKEIGCANWIFSTDDLPVHKEDTYKNVKKDFKASELKALGARGYWPGIRKDIVAYVEKSNPGFKFKEVRTYLKVTWPDKKITDDVVINTTDSESMGWDQIRLDLLPKDDFEKDLIGDILDEGAPKGTYNVRLHTFIRFTTGKTETHTYWDRNRWVTEHRPFMTDILVSYGEANIIK